MRVMEKEACKRIEEMARDLKKENDVLGTTKKKSFQKKKILSKLENSEETFR